MENNNRSKASKRMMKLIATQLKEMSKTTPLRKITVNDIAEFCEINRSTFYYHFIDKQDAINYVYHSEVTEPLRQLICQGESDNLSLFSLQRMHESKDFYCQAFKIEGQNDLKSYIHSEVLENWRMLSRIAVSQLAPNQNINMGEIYYVSDYLASGAFSMMSTWVADGMIDKPETIARLLDIAAGGMLPAYSMLISNAGKPLD